MKRSEQLTLRDCKITAFFTVWCCGTAVLHINLLKQCQSMAKARTSLPNVCPTCQFPLYRLVSS
eukprot:jgi/Botrbrau1/11331/Bobra.0038s0090.1